MKVSFIGRVGRREHMATFSRKTNNFFLKNKILENSSKVLNLYLEKLYFVELLSDLRLNFVSLRHIVLLFFGGVVRPSIPLSLVKRFLQPIIFSFHRCDTSHVFGFFFDLCRQRLSEIIELFFHTVLSTGKFLFVSLKIVKEYDSFYSIYIKR